MCVFWPNKTPLDGQGWLWDGRVADGAAGGAGGELGGARTAKYADFFHTGPNGIIVFGVPRNSSALSALSALGPEVSQNPQLRATLPHAPEARMTVVTQTPSNYPLTESTQIKNI